MASDGWVDRLGVAGYTALEERRLRAIGMIPGGPGAFSARAGRRVNGLGLAVSVATGPERAVVTPGVGIIFDASLAAGGAYTFEIPSSVAVNLAARPGSGTSRIDLVIARIYDADASVGSVREVKIEVVQGTAAASPVAPSLASIPLALVLATLTVPATGTGVSVSSSTQRTVSAGGVLPVATTAERDQLVTDGIAYSGLVVANEQTATLDIYVGGSWKRLTDPANVDWTPLTAASGWTAGTGSNSPQVSKDGNWGIYRGALGGGTANTQATTLPGFACPPSGRVVRVTTPIGTASVGYVRIFSNGAMNPSGDIPAEAQFSWKLT